MPVDGDKRAAWHCSAGSSATASSRLSRTRSVTPLAVARARMSRSSPTWLHTQVGGERQQQQQQQASIQGDAGGGAHMHVVMQGGGPCACGHAGRGAHAHVSCRRQDCCMHSSHACTARDRGTAGAWWVLTGRGRYALPNVRDVGGHNELANPLVRHPQPSAVVIQQGLALRYSSSHTVVVPH